MLCVCVFAREFAYLLLYEILAAYIIYCNNARMHNIIIIHYIVVIIIISYYVVQDSGTYNQLLNDSDILLHTSYR